MNDLLNIFILEDDKERVEWFKNTFYDCKVFVTCDIYDACDKLKNNKYDIIFLDRDLGHPLVSGECVAKVMEMYKLNTDSCIVIHTSNPIGKINIKKYLEKYHKNVYVIDFINLRKMNRRDFKLKGSSNG